LKGRCFHSTSGQRIQAVLVIGQIVIAVTLLVSADLLIRTFQSLQDNDLGFNPSKLLVAQIDLDDTRSLVAPRYYRTGISFCRESTDCLGLMQPL